MKTRLDSRLDLGLRFLIFLCKKIETIIIDGETIHRTDLDNDSMKIQNFYKYIQKNKEKITFIHYVDKEEITSIFFDDNDKMPRTIHKLSGPAIIHKSPLNKKDGISYYIDGEKLPEVEFNNHPKRKQFLRENKLERILNEQTEIHTC